MEYVYGRKDTRKMSPSELLEDYCSRVSTENTIQATKLYVFGESTTELDGRIVDKVPEGHVFAKPKE